MVPKSTQEHLGINNAGSHLSPRQHGQGRSAVRDPEPVSADKAVRRTTSLDSGELPARDIRKFSILYQTLTKLRNTLPDALWTGLGGANIWMEAELLDQIVSSGRPNRNDVRATS